MLHSLVQSLHSEMTDITQLNGLQRKYAAMVIQLQPWLCESPGVKDLTDCKKEIKSLKSQLRHKLADKQDAIEVWIIGSIMGRNYTPKKKIFSLAIKVSIVFNCGSR